MENGGKKTKNEKQKNNKTKIIRPLYAMDEGRGGPDDRSLVRGGRGKVLTAPLGVLSP